MRPMREMIASSGRFPERAVYGMFGLNGEFLYAHRYMCELVNGPAPSPEHHAAHSCGRGADGCVHPKHLSWKTQLENERDKAGHGINAWTHRNGVRHKLTEEQVAEIRSLEGKKTIYELERMFGVTRSNIRKILQRKTWVHGVRDVGQFSQYRLAQRQNPPLGELTAP